MPTTRENRVIIPKIYDKYRDGSKLSDAEIAYGLDFFKDVAEKLSCMGPVFHLAFVEANRVQMGLEGYKSARERK